MSVNSRLFFNLETNFYFRFNCVLSFNRRTRTERIHSFRKDFERNRKETGQWRWSCRRHFALFISFSLVCHTKRRLTCVTTRLESPAGSRTGFCDRNFGELSLTSVNRTDTETGALTSVPSRSRAMACKILSHD